MTGSVHNKSSYILLSAALFAGQRGLFADSDKLFAQAIGMTEKSAGHKSTEYATMLVRFADMCADHNRPDKAESLYKEALNIIEESRGTDHLSSALLMRNLSDVCGRLGNREDAIRWRFRAQEILSKHRVPKHSNGS